jgi:hypothetical protein
VQVFRYASKVILTQCSQPCHLYEGVEADGGDVNTALLSSGTVDRNFEVEDHQNLEVADQNSEVQVPHQNSDLLAGE